MGVHEDLLIPYKTRHEKSYEWVSSMSGRIKHFFLADRCSSRLKADGTMHARSQEVMSTHDMWGKYHAYPSTPLMW
jgi:hypothetical protein